MSELWWKEKTGFFGDFYIQGDNSVEGFLVSEERSIEERTIIEVEGLSKILDLTNNKKILDIPCGYGRHSIALAKLGHKVVGVDNNSAHLSKARSKAKEDNLQIQFHKKNMLNISYHEEYDVLINMFYSFGFFSTDADNLSVLKKFYLALKTGGKFLMHTDVNIPRIHSGQYKLHESRRLRNGGELVITEHYNKKNKRIDGSWEINHEGKSTTKNYSVRVYEKDEFIRMCLNVGFSNCEAFSGWNGESYSEDSEEVIFVATK